VVTVRDLSRNSGRVQALLDHIDMLERRTKKWAAAMQTAGHDVHSCLAALEGFIDLTLGQPSLPTTAVDNLRLAREIATRVGAIAERVQASAEEPLPGVPVALEALGHRLFRALQAAHPEVPFTWCVHAPDLCASLPPDALWEVLWNLLSNSVKYRSRERALHIALRAGFEQGEIWVEVRDNGRRIPQGEEEAVFRQGRRGANVGDTPGSGLGLFSARQLLARYSGRICAEPCLEGSIIRLAFSGWMTASPILDEIS
jgi:signal transduction histidine kinase